MGLRTRRVLTIVTVACVSLAAGFVTAGLSADDDEARATLHDGAGNEIGKVKFIQQGDAVLVKADDLEFAPTLAAGFKGFHIHAIGSCVAPSFTSAGGHYAGGGGTHGAHDGDMPVLLVDEDGTAWSRFKTDRFEVSDIVGLAVIVHAGPDNLANIPASRTYTASNVPAGGQAGTFEAYHSHDPNQGGGFGPDNASRATGDAGSRFACGVIED